MPGNVVEEIAKELGRRCVALSNNNWLLKAVTEKLTKQTGAEALMGWIGFVVALVKAAGTASDKRAAQVASEAVVAEACAKQHQALTGRFSRAAHLYGHGAHVATSSNEVSHRGRDFMLEIMSKQGWRIAPLPLAGAVNQLIDEQQGADLPTLTEWSRAT